MLLGLLALLLLIEAAPARATHRIERILAKDKPKCFKGPREGLPVAGFFDDFGVDHAWHWNGGDVRVAGPLVNLSSYLLNAKVHTSS